MKVEQLSWNASSGWKVEKDSGLKETANFVLCFGGIDVVNKPERFAEIQSKYPNAHIVSGSTAGEIIDDRVQDESIIATAIFYEKTQLDFIEIDVSNYENSFDCGKAIQEKLLRKGLVHILVISDGSMVNGDNLVAGINKNLPKEVIVTGGLAADAGRFSKTYVGLDKTPESGKIVAIGHYGSDLKVGHGSKGGWDEFGPIRTVTKSKGNVLYELDGQSALVLYKKYLGDKAADLPGSALLFPLSLYQDDGSQLVRTILSINEEEGSMTFAGDLPENSEVRLMMANFDRLIDGAANAAEASLEVITQSELSFVLMISCIGRRLVLDQRIEEEVESVKEIFGDDVIYSGFYSNGEISPVMSSAGCSLHNQTMTITTYSEN
ncbi:MAG: hypothetical protein ACI84C_000113 [Flavobacteriales bacterium]|jgi:hypothetical protein